MWTEYVKGAKVGDMNGAEESVGEEVLIRPTVKRISKTNSTKKTLVHKELSSFFLNKNYQMLKKMHNLFELVAKQINKDQAETGFSSLYMLYTFGRVKLKLEILLSSIFSTMER